MAVDVTNLDAVARVLEGVDAFLSAVPYYYNHKMKSAGTPIARHFGTRYPFGFGRSYTSFELADLELDIRPRVRRSFGEAQ